MPTSPRGVCRLTGRKKRTRLYRQPRADVGIGPYENTCVFSVGGAIPTSPRGVCRLSGRKKRSRLYRQPPGRCGHRPLQKTTCVFSVGGDARIAPWGMSPERAKKTDTPIPSASGPMRASAPTKNNVHFQRRGRCPHRPAGCVSRAVKKTDTPIPSASGPMRAV